MEQNSKNLWDKHIIIKEVKRIGIWCHNERESVGSYIIRDESKDPE